MRIIALCLLVLTVGAVSLWLNNVGQPWWVPPVVAMLSAIGVISVLRFGDEVTLFRKAAATTERFLFAGRRRSLTTVGVLVVALGFACWQGLTTIPPSADFLTVSLYREKRQPGHFAVGARVVLISETDGASWESKVGEDGKARFNNIVVPTTIDLQINETRDGIEWFWTPPRFPLTTLPWPQDYDLATVPERAWTPIGPVQPADTPLQVGSISPERDVEQIGDPALQAANAPWGVPHAPVIINRYAYILGIAPEARVPMWAAYAVAVTDQRVERQRLNFALDPAVPSDMQSTSSDYRGSGFDRGHLVSPQDVVFKGHVAALEAMYQTTLTPQVPRLNRFAWALLERATRDLALHLGREVYVIDGPLFEYSGTPPGIGANNIPVPSHFFRVITWVAENGMFQWAAYLLPNAADVPLDFQERAVSIAEIEKRTGLEMLPLLDPTRSAPIKQGVRSLPTSPG